MPDAAPGTAVLRRTSIRVRSADLERDREALIDLLATNLPRITDRSVFDWLYLRNPAGPARVWMATDQASGRVIGAASAFPRCMYAAGQEIVGWVLGDFCVAVGHRSLGPALALQRAVLAATADATLPFFYDFPSRHMLAVYARLGVAPPTRMVRLTRVLRANSTVTRVLGSPRLASVLAWPLNLLLTVSTYRGAAAPGGVAITTHDGPCREEFDVLDGHLAGQRGVRVKRSARYLDWRFLNNPIQRCELTVARTGQRLLAYAVVTWGPHATLLDLFGVDDPPVVTALVDFIAHRLRAAGSSTLSVSTVSGHPMMAMLAALGFSERDDHPVVIHGPASPPGTPGSWLLMPGDRDS